MGSLPLIGSQWILGHRVQNCIFHLFSLKKKYCNKRHGAKEIECQLWPYLDILLLQLVLHCGQNAWQKLFCRSQGYFADLPPWYSSSFNFYDCVKQSKHRYKYWGLKSPRELVSMSTLLVGLAKSPWCLCPSVICPILMLWYLPHRNIFDIIGIAPWYSYQYPFLSLTLESNL